MMGNRYTVLSPLMIAGEKVTTGVVTMSSEDAAALVACGVLALVIETVPDTSTHDRMAIIAAAISELDEDNKDHWTHGGKPNIRTLASITGSLVKAKERDDAWDAIQSTGEQLNKLIAAITAMPKGLTPDADELSHDLGFTVTRSDIAYALAQLAAEAEQTD